MGPGPSLRLSSPPAPRSFGPLQPARLSLHRRIGLVALAIALGALAQLEVRRSAAPVFAKPKLTTIADDSRDGSAFTRETPTDRALSFYFARIRRDSEDTRSQNALSELYLQQVRETGNEDYLPPAKAAAEASLAAVPAERNLGGLTALAHAEFSDHAFPAAREHARQLINLQPTKSEPYAILGDAALELGDYEEAANAYEKMRQRAAQDAGTETRLARLAILQGRPAEGRSHLEAALERLHQMTQPPNETMAWCHWQLGEVAFSSGDHGAAEKHLAMALQVSPGYFRALASLGKLRAAQHDLPAAIVHYEEAIRIVPVIDFMASLGDLYQLSGRSEDARVRYELAEELGAHSLKVHGVPYDRRLALFLADHDLKPEQAYRWASDEYAAGRHDIYGADALAWTALKAGHLAQARTAMKEALRLGTRDAKLYYHAGMIARAAEENAEAKSFLERALALNPEFDPLQSVKARQVLERLAR